MVSFTSEHDEASASEHLLLWLVRALCWAWSTETAGECTAGVPGPLPIFSAPSLAPKDAVFSSAGLPAIICTLQKEKCLLGTCEVVFSQQVLPLSQMVWM